MTSIEKKQYYLYGEKHIKKDDRLETGILDTTTLFIKIYEGTDESGKLIAEGTLYFPVPDLMKAVTGWNFHCMNYIACFLL